MKLKRKHWVIIVLILTIVGIPFYAFKIEPRWLRVRTIRISDRPTLRIAHMSDLHFKGDADWLKAVVAATNELNPDIVCITGDFVEKAEFQPTVIEILRELSAPIVAVIGNHDVWSKADLKPLKSLCNESGGKLLLNEEFELKGISFFGANEATDVKPVDGDRRVLLCHYPAAVDNLNGTRYDLVLAGHTHGGQIRLPFIGALITPYGTNGYDMGIYEVNESLLHVSPGIGTLRPNVRFFCRPEVTLILF
jgi:predicted MPP superfamily phosphohydrolase